MITDSLAGKSVQRILLIIALSLFLGQAWHHFNLGIPAFPGLANFYIQLIGSFLVLGGLLSIITYIKKGQASFNLYYFLAAGYLCFLSMTKAWAKQWEFPQLIEHTIQWTLPLTIVLLYRSNSSRMVLANYLKVIIAFTFVGHGLYASGLFPQPSNFLFMTSSILHIEIDTASYFLKLMGILDFLAAIGLFLPGKWLNTALVYCIIWGFLTAFARVIAYTDLEQTISDIDRWLPETLYRLCHGGVPLILFLLKDQLTEE